MSEEVNQRKKVNRKIVSKTYVGIGLVSAGCGAFHGFYDGMEIPLPYKHLDAYLTFGPPIVQSFLGILDGTNIARTGRQVTGNYPVCMESELSSMIKKSEGEKIINGELYGGLIGWMGEGIAAGVETLLGYGLGYLAGKIVKSFS